MSTVRVTVASHRFELRWVLTAGLVAGALDITDDVIYT